MKYRNIELTKVTMLYSKAAFIVSAILFFVEFSGYLLLTQIEKNTVQLPDEIVSNFGLLILSGMLFIAFVFQFRFRTISKKGITATFLGIPYKHISWNDVIFCKVDLVKVWAGGDRYYENFRYMIIFKSRLNRRYKATLISIDETPITRALVEKYYGKIDYEKRKHSQM